MPTIQQLVLAVADNHLAQSLVLLDAGPLLLEQLLSGRHDNRQRGLQLISDIGEEESLFLLGMALYVQGLLPPAPTYPLAINDGLDGVGVEVVGRTGTFLGDHIHVTLQHDALALLVVAKHP